MFLYHYIISVKKYKAVYLLTDMIEKKFKTLY